MTRCGIGPKFFTIAVLYGIPAGWLTCRFPDLFSIKCVPYWIVAAFGVALLAAGVTIYIKALRTFNTDYGKGALTTKGPFSVVRHPIYAAWILLIIPGFVLFFRSWLLLGVPLAAYVAFRALIHEEDDHLQRKFGRSYLKYRFRVNEMFPFGKSRNR